MGDCDEAVRVVDADGEVAGVVTQGGLLQALANTKKDKNEAGSGGKASS
jgi:CBS-domain-containing membrane protein